MATEPDNQERNQRVADLIHQVNLETSAPASLHASIGALRSERQRRSNPLTRLRLGVAGIASTAAVAVALVIGIGGTTAAPALAQVVALSGRAPTGAAPAADAARPQTLLSAQIGGLHFPNWEADGGWRASGQRSDTLRGRHVLTVYYTRGGTRLVYSIVDSPAVWHAAGGAYEVYRDGARVTVVWDADNHTCVLTGRDITPESLWKLAGTTLS